MAVLALLLLPTAAGRFLLDLAGGLLILVLILPLVLAGAGWIGWTLLQSRMRTCATCGAVSFSAAGVCTVCGSELPGPSSESQSETPSTPASQAVIDVSVKEID